MRRVLEWFWRHKRFSTILLVAIVILFFVIRGRGGDGGFEEAVVMRGEVAEELVLSGEIVADEHVQLVFPTSGKISWIEVSEGERVEKGRALAKLDTIALNASLNRAQSDYRAAQANAEEVLDDVKGNDDDETFEQKNDRTTAEVARDKAYDAMVIAQKNLSESTLVAPFDGLVTYVANPFAGVNVLPTQTQIEIVNPSTIYFEVFADQTEVVDISQGDMVDVIMDAGDNVEIEGSVSHISYATVVGEIGAVYPVRVDFVSSLASGFVYRVGMTGDAHFVLNQRQNVLYVPAGFIKSDDQGDYVLVEGGREKAYVEVGLEGEDRTEIVNGLDEGTAIYD